MEEAGIPFPKYDRVIYKKKGNLMNTILIRIIIIPMLVPIEAYKSYY